jgi:hypothetical protein
VQARTTYAAKSAYNDVFMQKERNMRTLTTVGLAAIVGLAACAQRPIAVDTGSIDVLSWRGTLSRPATADSTAVPMNIAGSATLRPASNPSESETTVMVANATPNATLPWHIHAGSCGSGGGIVGPASAYKPLVVAADGTAEVTVRLPFTTPTQGEFYVNVHKSPSELGVIVACGRLSMRAIP